jgi:hypothetical protein
MKSPKKSKKKQKVHGLSNLFYPTIELVSEFIFYSVAQHSQFFMENCFPASKSCPLITEDFIISDNPNTP